MNLVFREAEKADIDTCTDIILSSEVWSPYSMDYEKAYNMLSSTQDKLYVAEINGCIVGFVTLRANGIGNFGAFVRLLAVKDGFRGKGIGKQLVEFATKIAANHDRNLFLLCSTKNSLGISFYESSGFEKIGVLGDLFVDGHDEILFRKRI